MSNEEKETLILSAFEDEIPFDPSNPEKNLLRALLMTAMADANKSGPVRRQAIEYFLNPDQDYIFSFRSVCDYLGIDPNSILTAAGIKRRDNTADRMQ